MDFFRDIPIQITHRPGEVKVGKDRSGIGWASKMKASRGIIKGLDGNGVVSTKAWIGPNQNSDSVFVVHQQTSEGIHDETKLVLGFDDPVTAAQTIMGHYPKAQHPIDSIHQIPNGGLEDWISENEAWGITAKEHHGLPHLHKNPVVTFNGHRLPAEKVDPNIPEEITKAYEPMQPGDRWISVHPGGPGSKGQPVLLRPVEGHPGLHRVVGGAGGRLNFLRIHLTKDPAQYKQEAIERRNQQRAMEKESLAKMTPEERKAKVAQTAKAKEDRTKAEAHFIKQVLGDDSQEGEAPDLFSDTPEADPKAKMAYHRERLKQAFAACKEAARTIELDAEARIASGLQEVGGGATPGLAIDAILTTKDDRGPGYDRAITERAEANGLTAEKLVAATAAWKEAQGLAPKGNPAMPGAPKDAASTDAAITAHVATKELQKAKSEATAIAVKEALADHKKLGDLLVARAALRQAYEEAVTAKTGRVFQQGFLATTSEPTPEDKEALVADLTEKLIRSHVSQFLDEVEMDNPDNEGIQGAWNPKDEEGMAAARGGAAWTALHEAGLAIFGAGLLDRDTVETLGPEAAAQVLARAIRNRFEPADQKEIIDALEAAHIQEQQTELPQATQEAQNLRAEAQTMKDQFLTTPKDFAAAAEMHRTRLEALKQARTILGGALGRFESRAALIAALQSTPAENLQVPMGRTSPERAMQAAAAMGLMPNDYQLDHSGGEAVLTIPSDSQDKLIKPIDHAAVAERELALSIKRGDMDEQGYLPQGFARRTASRYDNPLMEPPVFQRKIELPEGADAQRLEPALARYIGQRWADGHRATDINADLRGVGIRDEVPSHLHGELDQLVNKLIPTHELVRDESGEPVPERHDGKVMRDTAGQIVYKTKMREPKQIAADVEALGRKYLDASGDTETLEGQTVDSDSPDFREALHRALADDPRLQAAHAGVGELTHLQQHAIRDWFYREHHGKKGDELANALQSLGPEPTQFDETTGGMSLFEDMGPTESPEYQEFQKKKNAIVRKFSPGEAQRQDLQQQLDDLGPAPQAGTSFAAAHAEQKALLEKRLAAVDTNSQWASYIEKMGGLKPATEALQSEMQSKLAEKFHAQYSHVTGHVLQMGTGDIAHFASHAKATAGAEAAAEMEAARKAKQASMQKQGGGKFKSVKVKEKMEQAAEAGLFGQGGSLFGSEELDGDTPTEETPKWEKPEAGPGERLRLGTRIEAQIAAAMPNASAPFQSRELKSVKVAEGMNMDGHYAPQQRGVKAFNLLHRMGLFYGAGSGKTSVMLGGASDLISSGKGKKVLMSVPSIVQEQFGAEAANFLDPKTGIRVHAVPGETFEQRLAAYRDPEQHAVVMTHAAVRDDSVKLLASHLGKTEDEAATWAMQTTPEDLKQNLKDAFAKEGINFDALMVDEGHDALNRKGKPDSLLAKIIDAHGHNAPNYIGATGSPVKNDSCLHPDTPIYDPVINITRTVKEWKDRGERPWVWALDETTQIPKLIQASVPWIKLKNRPMFRVRSNRNEVVVAADHKFLTPSGWAHLSDLQEGDMIASVPDSLQPRLSSPILGLQHEPRAFLPTGPCVGLQKQVDGPVRFGTISRAFLLMQPSHDAHSQFSTESHRFGDDPSVLSAQQRDGGVVLQSSSSPRGSRGYVPHLTHKVQGSRPDCHVCPDLYDGQPLLGRGIGQACAPSPTDARQQTHVYQHGDAMGPKHEYKHPHSAPPSMNDVPRPYASPGATRASCNMGSLYQCNISEHLQELNLGSGPTLTEGSILHQPIHGSDIPTDQICSSPSTSWVQFEPIQSINQEGCADIYDLTVPELHNYFTCGLWHHNTEAYDWLHKIDPARYPREGRDEFLRRYGSDSAISRRGLKAELSRYFFAERVGSGVSQHNHDAKITLTAEQHQRIDTVERAAAKLRLGEDPVKWAKELAPNKFVGVPPEQEQAIAEGVKKAVGTFREAAMDRIINIGGAKMQAAVKMAQDSVAEGKPMVIFAHRLEAVAELHKAMEAAGLRVASISGLDSSKDKPGKLAAFQGGPGRPATADVLIASDAAATGANLQRGKAVVHYDQPMTAKTHQQRTARVDRLGQTEDVEVTNLLADHAWDRNARARVAKKAILADVYQSKEGYLDDSGIGQTLRALRARGAQAKEEAA